MEVGMLVIIYGEALSYITESVKWLEFIDDWIRCTTPRNSWCHIIVLNLHAPTENKSDDTKDNFYEELECVENHFLEHSIKILRDFKVKVGREREIFKQTTGNENLHEICNDNGVWQ
jgi:hypothetical protein